MLELNNYILEKLKIDKRTELNHEEEKPQRQYASKGASIENDMDKMYQFMMYDENSGIISCFEADSYNDLVKDFGMEEKDAKSLCNLNKGASEYDSNTGAIITLIS